MPDTSPEMTVVPQRCGTCGHEHAGPLTLERYAAGALPPCPTCDCTTFALHPDDVAAADAADSAEQAAATGERLLHSEIALGLHAVLLGFERQLDDRGWSQGPMCGVLHGIRPTPGPAGTSLMGVAVAPLNLDYAALLDMAEGNPQVFVPLLADMAERHPRFFDAYRKAAGIDPADPALAWWCSYEGWIKKDPGGSAHADPALRLGELRQVVCIDVDERVHQVTRNRGTGQVQDTVHALPAYLEAVAGDAANTDTGMISAVGGGMAPHVEGLLRLIRVTRSATVVRGVFSRGTA